MDVLDVGVGLGERLVQSTIQIQGDIIIYKNIFKTNIFKTNILIFLFIESDEFRRGLVRLCECPSILGVCTLL